MRWRGCWLTGCLLGALSACGEQRSVPSRPEPAPPRSLTLGPATPNVPAASIDSVSIKPTDGYSIALDLSDTWVPAIFRSNPELGEVGQHPYHDIYVRLANEQYTEEDVRAQEDRYLELYGIFPSPSVLSRRMSDETRHQCHERIDSSALKNYAEPLRPRGVDEQETAVKRYAMVKRKLQSERTAHGVATNAELVVLAPKVARWVRLGNRIGPRIEAIRVVHARLACEGLLSRRASDGVFDAWTLTALRAYQRLHMIPSFGQLDGYTRELMLESSRELDYRAALRMLRERVIDATALIEDGSACAEHGKIMDHELDAPDFHATDKYGALPNCARDLISPRVELTAKQLGWKDPVSTADWLRQHAGSEQATFEIYLDPPPSYYSKHMQLRAEIDRGDVYYDFPYDARGHAKAQRVERRPTTTIYAQDGAGEIALVRWSTTIGSWKSEKLERYVAMKYKNSDVGPRVWRDVIAAPAWLPPPSTPTDELVRKSGGQLVLNRAIFGPGYNSAYGLVMMVHHRAITRNKKTGPETAYWDQGIRSHGSVSYQSILRGYSHGCHRLFNHQAVRLGTFLLAHRHHLTRGNEAVRYVNEFSREGHHFRLELKTRGYAYELTPPVPVNVLEGNLRGKRKTPPEGARPLRSRLLLRASSAAAAD